MESQGYETNILQFYILPTLGSFFLSLIWAILYNLPANFKKRKGSLEKYKANLAVRTKTRRPEEPVSVFLSA